MWFDVSQTAGKATAESIEVTTQMGNQNRNRKGATQSVSLYNLYKNRSYRCQVTMMGNALIQPTMYFNLRNVPMFSGPYMILEVSHRISPGSFTTYFTGVRQPTASLPILDDYIQSLRKNLLQSIIEKLEQDKIEQERQANANNPKNNTASNTSLITDCIKNAYKDYQKFSAITPTQTTINVSDMYKKIVDTTPNVMLQKLIFCRIYFSSLDNSNTNRFTSVNNNYAGIFLDSNNNWGANGEENLSKKFYCALGNTVNAVFENEVKVISLLKNKWESRVVSVKDNITDITKFIVNNYDAKTNNNAYNSLNSVDRDNYTNIINNAVNLFNTLKNR